MEALAEASAAAAAKAEAELAKVRADAAAQLEAAAGVLAEVKAELKAEVATVKRESATQLQRIQQAELALGSAAALKLFRASPAAAGAQAARAVPSPHPPPLARFVKGRRVWSRWPLRGARCTEAAGPGAGRGLGAGGAHPRAAGPARAPGVRGARGGPRPFNKCFGRSP